jgi:hypothetical protein
MEFLFTSCRPHPSSAGSTGRSGRSRRGRAVLFFARERRDLGDDDGRRELLA